MMKKKFVMEMKDEYDKQVDEHNELLEDAYEKDIKIKYENAFIPFIDTTGRKYPTKLKHGQNKLPPYYLGECKKSKCKNMAKFKCFYYTDKKSIPVKCATKYISCKRALCDEHALETLKT